MTNDQGEQCSQIQNLTHLCDPDLKYFVFLLVFGDSLGSSVAQYDGLEVATY